MLAEQSAYDLLGLGPSDAKEGSKVGSCITEDETERQPVPGSASIVDDDWCALRRERPWHRNIVAIIHTKCCRADDAGDGLGSRRPEGRLLRHLHEVLNGIPHHQLVLLIRVIPRNAV